MIRTIPADLILLFFVGLVFAQASLTRSKTEKPSFCSRHLLASLLFSIFSLPISIYCYYLYPAWCWMYWVDPGKVPLFGVVIVFSVYLLSAALGFILLFKFASWRKGSQFWLFLIAIFGLLFLGALFPERLFLLGTLQDFQNQTLVPVFEAKPVFFTILIGGAALLPLGLYMIKLISRTPVNPN